ncbi:MAG: hypothetical protein NXI32_04800, partial [bacterium]|nr:hypothetical protein [bacterium]
GVVAVGAYAGENGSGAYANILLGFASRIESAISNAFVAGSSGDLGGGYKTHISDVYFGSGVTDSDPKSYVIHGTGGSGTDVAGANVSLAGGIGTGSADGGSLNFRTAAAGSSGATANTLTTHMTINSDGLILLPTIPTSDPAVAGALWSDSGTLKISAG